MIESRKIFCQGLLWAVIAVFVWSGSLVLLRMGVTTNLNAYDLTALRFGTAALLLMPVILKQGFAFPQLGVGGILIMISGFGAPYIILISLAMKTAPAAAAGALNPGFMAVSSVIMAAIFFKDKIGIIGFTGITLILSGLLFSVLLQPSGFTSGHMILIFTGAMWAAYALTVRKSGIPALQATAIVAVGSAILYLPIYSVILPKKIDAAPLWDILLQAGFQGVLVSVVAVFAFNRSLELLGPVIGSTLPALIPLVTLALGFVLLNESVETGGITTAILIGFGVAVILVGRRSSNQGKTK